MLVSPPSKAAKSFIRDRALGENIPSLKDEGSMHKSIGKSNGGFKGISPNENRETALAKHQVVK